MARSMPTGSNGTSIYGSGRKDTPLCECHNSLNKDLIPYEDAVCPSGTGEGAGAPVMRNTCPTSISRHSHFRCPGCTHAQHSCPGARAMAQKQCHSLQDSLGQKKCFFPPSTQCQLWRHLKCRRLQGPPMARSSNYFQLLSQSQRRSADHPNSSPCCQVISYVIKVKVTRAFCRLFAWLCFKDIKMHSGISIQVKTETRIGTEQINISSHLAGDEFVLFALLLLWLGDRSWK